MDLKFFKTDRNLTLQDDNDTEHRVLQPIWDLRLGLEDWMTSPLFPVFLSIGFYFLCNIPYTIVDLYFQDLSIVKRFKIQPDKRVTWPMMRKAILKTLYNNIVYILPTIIAQWIWVPPTPFPKLAPKFYDFAYQSVAMMMIFDFQYWFWHMVHHRNRWLYKNFHAIHHQYHATFGWTTQYLHPWELVTVGFFTTIDGWFFECHPMTYWCFMLLNVGMSVEAHSGYDLPIFPHKWLPIYGGGPKHDMHHMKPLTNYQPFFSTWDRLFGWDCPGISGGGVKGKRLLAWEERRRGQRINKHATELMGGTENGELVPDKDRKRE